MLTRHWLLWAGRLAVCGALALPGRAVQADEPQDGDNPRARERGDRDNPPGEGRRGPRPDRGREDQPDERGGRGARQRPGDQYWLGIECFPVPGLLRDQLSLPEDQGLVVEFTAPESPAAEAGLKKHDILLAADGKPVASMHQLFEIVQASEGKAIEFKLLRGGKETTVSVTPSKGGPALGRGFPGREQFDRAMQQMREMQERAERQGDAIRMRFYHPGMVLPPGMGLQPPLPDDMRVTITREGKKPAEIEVHQGDETWKGTEEDLEKMPEKFRAPVARMLGRLPFMARVDVPGASFEAGAGGGFRSRSNPPGPPEGRPGREAGDAGPRGRRGPPEGNLDERMRELSRQVDRIREEIESIRQRRGSDADASDRKDAPPAGSDDAPAKP